MPYYKPLEELNEPERIHIIENIQKLRLQLKKDVPERTNRSTLLLSTWNLREFSNEENRLEESFWYIAEIISFFDLIALQEIGNNMTALNKLMSILGYKFDYIVTDTPNAEGGSERIAFVFNTGKVKFKNIAGEVFLSSEEQVKYNLPNGFARSPYMVAFQASWFKFNLCSVHIYFGKGKEGKSRRINEISAIAKKLNERAIKEGASYILLGDFNIEKVGDQFYNALVGSDDTKTGFYIRSIEKSFTNMKGDRSFDQIAFNLHNVSLKDLDIDEANKKVKKGVVKYYDAIFNDTNYYKNIAQQMYKKKGCKMPENWDLDVWRTYQISDHLPLWIELKIDFTDQYLESLKVKKAKIDEATQIPKI